MCSIDGACDAPIPPTTRAIRFPPVALPFPCLAPIDRVGEPVGEPRVPRANDFRARRVALLARCLAPIAGSGRRGSSGLAAFAHLLSHLGQRRVRDAEEL